MFIELHHSKFPPPPPPPIAAAMSAAAPTAAFVFYHTVDCLCVLLACLPANNQYSLM
jgi:hypothetical protein